MQRDARPAPGVVGHCGYCAKPLRDGDYWVRFGAFLFCSETHHRAFEQKVDAPRA